MVNLRKIFAFALALIVFALPAAAQFIGFTSPQTVQQSLATGALCTGSAQSFPVQNLGQTQHFLSVASVIGAAKFQAEIDGVDNQGNTYRISDVIENLTGQVFGVGYFPIVRVIVTCSPNTATFTISYSGTSATASGPFGAYQNAQVDKVSFNVAPENTSISDNYQTPFSSTAGTVLFQYTTASISGSVLTILCKSLNTGFATVQAFTLANVLTLQTFQMPDVYCPIVSVQYATGGGGAGTITAEYVFTNPGRTVNALQFSHTGTATTTAVPVKQFPGFIHTVSINTGAAGTLSLFDLAGASCTGTPATNTIAVITAVAGTLQTFIYDVNALNGICAKASVGMDYTVSFQ